MTEYNLEFKVPVVLTAREWLELWKHIRHIYPLAEQRAAIESAVLDRAILNDFKEVTGL